MSLSRAQRAGGAVLIGALSVLTIILVVSIGSVRSRSSEADGFLGLVIARIPDEEVSRLIDFLERTEYIAVAGNTTYTATVHPSIIVGFSGSTVHSLTTTGVIDREGEVAPLLEKSKGTASLATTRNALSGEEVRYTLVADAVVHARANTGDAYLQRESLTIKEAPVSLELIALRTSYLREYQNTRLHRTGGFQGPGLLRETLTAITTLPKRRVVENSDGTISLLASGDSILLSGAYDQQTKKMVFTVEDSTHDSVVTVDETHIDGTYDIRVERKTTGTETFSGLLRIVPKRNSIDITIEGRLQTRFTQSLQILQTMELRRSSPVSVDIPELSLEMGVVFGEK